jgi:hypothetical protein
MADDAANRCSGQPMMAGHVATDAADRCAFQATCGSLAANGRKGRNQRCGNKLVFHEINSFRGGIAPVSRPVR